MSFPTGSTCALTRPIRNTLEIILQILNGLLLRGIPLRLILPYILRRAVLALFVQILDNVVHSLFYIPVRELGRIQIICELAGRLGAELSVDMGPFSWVIIPADSLEEFRPGIERLFVVPRPEHRFLCQSVVTCQPRDVGVLLILWEDFGNNIFCCIERGAGETATLFGFPEVVECILQRIC